MGLDDRAGKRDRSQRRRGAGQTGASLQLPYTHCNGGGRRVATRGDRLREIGASPHGEWERGGAGTRVMNHQGL